MPRKPPVDVVTGSGVLNTGVAGTAVPTIAVPTMAVGPTPGELDAMVGEVKTCPSALTNQPCMTCSLDAATTCCQFAPPFVLTCKLKRPVEDAGWYDVPCPGWFWRAKGSGPRMPPTYTICEFARAS